MLPPHPVICQKTSGLFNRPESTPTGQPFPLSPRERAGVRRNRTAERFFTTRDYFKRSFALLHLLVFARKHPAYPTPIGVVITPPSAASETPPEPGSPGRDCSKYPSARPL